MRSPLALACLAATAGWAGIAAAATIEPGTYVASGGAPIRLLVEPARDGNVAFLLHRSSRGGVCLMSGMAKPVGDTITWTSNSGANLAIHFDGRGATVETSNALPQNCDGAPRIAGAYVFDNAAIEYDRAEIGAVQGALNGQGYRLGRVDGVAGQRTLAAVRDYQQKNNIPSPNNGLTLETVAHLASGGRPVAATPSAPTPVAPATAPAATDAGAAAPQTDTAAATPTAPAPASPPPPLRWLDPIPDRLIPLLEARYAPMVSPAVINWRDAPFQVAEMELDEKPGQLTPDVIVFWNDAKHCDDNGCPWEILAEGSQSLTPVADGKARDFALAPSYTGGKRDLLVDGNRLFRWNGKGWAPEYYKPEKVR